MKNSIKSALKQRTRSISKTLAEPVEHPIFALVQHELCLPIRKHAAMNSAHEGYAVIKEELDEFWQETMKRREDRSSLKMKAELIQVAAMAVRTIIDLHL